MPLLIKFCFPIKKCINNNLIRVIVGDISQMALREPLPDLSLYSLSLCLVVYQFVGLSYCRAAGISSEEALDRLPTSATCMNLLKLPPYRRFVLILILFLKMEGILFLGPNGEPWPLSHKQDMEGEVTSLFLYAYDVPLIYQRKVTWIL